jgi:adenylate cyclase
MLASYQFFYRSLVCDGWEAFFMPIRVLLLQSDPTSAQALSDYFLKRGDKVWKTAQIDQAGAVLKKEAPDLLFLDLHLPGNDWLEILTRVHQIHPNTRVVMTNKHPDYRRELIARQRGVQLFLRQPFTAAWIERVLQKMDGKSGPATKTGSLPKVRVPMKVKITFPYFLLAIIFSLASAFLISRYILESLQDRFTAQLVDVGKLSADWMVQEESRILETLRLLANTEGVAEAVESLDAGRIREIALPIAVNYQEEAVHILDKEGFSLLTMVHKPDGSIEEYITTQGDSSLIGLDFIQKILQQQADPLGNKHAGLAQGPAGAYFTIAGPILNANGNLVGVAAVGKSLPTLSQQIRQDTLAQVTFYGLDGFPIASSLLMQEEVFPVPKEVVARTLQRQDSAASMRELTVASTSYSEILGPWEARGGADLGLFGASLAQNYLSRPSTLARFQVFIFVLLAFLGVIALGLFLAHQITHPLSQIVQASVEVARGNLEIKVPSRGNDEVMVLAHAFNVMVSGLQEGFIYRDLLGRTVSPEVREALRRSFASGDLRLEGQNATATVLMSDIRGFTTISEKEEPTTILNWLNEYFSELVPIITSHGGVVDKFEGDAMLAFFGILPTPLPAQDSACQACLAAIEMLAVIETINTRRAGRGEPPLVTGISVNSGSLTAGSLGTSDRLNYTIIGDTVNTTQRMGEVTREFGESGIVVSENTLQALSELRSNFNFEPLGEHAFKGKIELLWLYRLLPSQFGRGRMKIASEIPQLKR